MPSFGTTLPRPRRCGAAGSCRLNEARSGGQHFENVPVRVLEIKAAAAIAAVDLHVGARARAAALGDALRLDPVEDRVELGPADPERIKKAFENPALLEIEGQLLVEPGPPQ